MNCATGKVSPELRALLKEKPLPDLEIMRGYQAGELFTRSAANHHNKRNRQQHGLFTGHMGYVLYRRHG